MATRLLVSGAVIVQNNRVLLVRDAEDEFWKVPGGRVETTDEDMRAATAREVLEETGSEPVFADRDPWVQYLRLQKPEGIVEVLLIHWLATIESDAHASGEVIECTWFDKTNLPKNLAPNIIPALQAFHIIA